MLRYVVRFMKVVLGENGHEAENTSVRWKSVSCRQPHASDLAKVSFYESERVKDWSLHADRVHITAAEWPS